MEEMVLLVTAGADAAARLGTPVCCVCGEVYIGPLRQVKIRVDIDVQVGATRTYTSVYGNLRICRRDCNGTAALQGRLLGEHKDGHLLLKGPLPPGDYEFDIEAGWSEGRRS